jgi:riboflavin biosynthesis pyrimidine reductase
VRRLLPDPGPVDPAAAIAEARTRWSATGRPYVIANFVSSLDGRASIDGGSSGLGDAGDREVFRALRACADAVLVGTGTLAAEHYGALVREPSVSALRARLGLPAQPPLVTVTRSGRIPDIPLLDDPESTLIVYCGAAPALGEVAASVHVELRPPEALTLPAVLADLRRTHGIERLLCEGGPSILGDLVAAGVCDELFLTLAPKLAGGDGPAITRPVALDDPPAATLLWVFEQAGSLFLRYRLNG